MDVTSLNFNFSRNHVGEHFEDDIISICAQNSASMDRIAHQLDSQKRTDDVELSRFEPAPPVSGGKPFQASKVNQLLSFSSMGLSKNLLKGLQSAGFHRPSPVQFNAIPLGRMGVDMIVQAKSGTGKTVVFSVILLEAVNPSRDVLQSIVVSPTREIALQSVNVIRQLGQFIPGLQCQLFVGGFPLSDDIQKLKSCHIAVGTPGRLKYLINAGHLSCEQARILILDEADLLFSGNATVAAGGEVDLLSGKNTFPAAVNYIWWAMPEVKQVIALSATYTEYLVEHHLPRYLSSPALVRLSADDPTLLGVKQFFCLVHSKSAAPLDIFKMKTKRLCEILSAVDFKQCLVFSNFQNSAQELCETLRRRGWPVSYISSGLDQEERFKAFHRLRSFQCRILVSTDLTSRGVDAENINLVVSLEVPWKRDIYLHRIGRAGRFGSYGASILLVSDKADELKTLTRIEDPKASPILQLPEPLPADLATSDYQVDLTKLVSIKRLTSKSKPDSVVYGDDDEEEKSGEFFAPPSTPEQFQFPNRGKKGVQEAEYRRTEPATQLKTRSSDKNSFSELLTNITTYADAARSLSRVNFELTSSNGGKILSSHESNSDHCFYPEDLERKTLGLLSDFLESPSALKNLGKDESPKPNHSFENVLDSEIGVAQPKSAMSHRSSRHEVEEIVSPDPTPQFVSEPRQLTPRQSVIWNEYCRLVAWKDYYLVCWEGARVEFEEKLQFFKNMKSDFEELQKLSS